MRLRWSLPASDSGNETTGNNYCSYDYLNVLDIVWNTSAYNVLFFDFQTGVGMGGKQTFQPVL